MLRSHGVCHSRRENVLDIADLEIVVDEICIRKLLC